MPAQMARTGAHRDPIESCSSETLDRVRDHLRQIADPRGVATVTTRRLGDDLELGPTTVRRALRLLEDAGETELLRRGTGGRYGTRYRVVATAPAPSAA